MEDSIIKSGRKKAFVVLFREVAQDERLSLEARGLFTLMVSLPENWEYSVRGLAGKAGCGKDKIRRLLGELEKVGYLVREQSHDSGGKFAGNVYILQDEAPLSGNTDNGKNRQRENTLTGNRSLNNKERKVEDLNNPPKSPKGDEGEKPKEKRTSKFALAEEAKPLLRDYVGEDKELHRVLGDFITNRELLRAINSERAIRSVLKELDRLSGGRREEKIAILEQSIRNSWKSVFPLKGGQAPTLPQTAPTVAPERFGWD